MIYNANDVMLKRVVITGLGCVTPLGITASSTWNNLIAGSCGITHLKSEGVEHLPCQIGGSVKEFNDIDVLNANERRSANRTTGFAMSAAVEATNQACLNFTEIDCDRAGVCFGSSLAGFMETVSTSRSVNETQKRGYRRVSPFFVPRILDNMAAGAIAMRFNLLGPNHSCGTACTTGAHSVGDGFNIIRLGMADVMLCGSAEACLHPLAISGFSQAKALCTDSNDKPTKSSRPFDESRSGFVMSEGAAVLVMEEMQHALNRGAHILAEVAGYGLSADAHHITAPHPDGRGALNAMRGALRGISLSRVSYINAHATSTPLGDLAEGTAIRQIFNLDQEGTGPGPYVSSSKGSLGHLLGGAGSVEALICVQSIAQQTVPHTLNLSEPCCELSHVTEPVHDVDVDHVLTNSFGFGGTNASLLFKRFDKAGG